MHAGDSPLSLCVHQAGERSMERAGPTVDSRRRSAKKGGRRGQTRPGTRLFVFRRPSIKKRPPSPDLAFFNAKKETVRLSIFYFFFVAGRDRMVCCGAVSSAKVRRRKRKTHDKHRGTGRRLNVPMASGHDRRGTGLYLWPFFCSWEALSARAASRAHDYTSRPRLADDRPTVVSSECTKFMLTEQSEIKSKKKSQRRLGDMRE